MTELVLPTTAVHASFLAAMAEFRAEGRGVPTDASTIGHELRELAATWTSREGFASYVADVRADALDETPRPDGWVPSTTWWLVDADRYLARIALRHRLTPWLLEVGGHIGYDVRRSARGRGHATSMLAQVLSPARAIGIERALVTCEVDNVASRRVIESNGGALEDIRAGKRRYWVPTG